MKFTLGERSVLLCLLLAVLLTAPAWPQASTANVSGTVRDQSAAVIPAATVTLVNKGTNVTTKTIANEAGFYLFPGVLPGPYLLSAEAPGMQKFEGNLTVQVQQSTVVNITLNVGQTAVEVAVRDVTPVVQSDSPTLSHTLERTRIDQLPLAVDRAVRAAHQLLPLPLTYVVRHIQMHVAAISSVPLRHFGRRTEVARLQGFSRRRRPWWLRDRRRQRHRVTR